MQVVRKYAPNTMIIEPRKGSLFNDCQWGNVSCKKQYEPPLIMGEISELQTLKCTCWYVRKKSAISNTFLL